MSAILSSEALNDFIAPSIACIKPIEPLPSLSLSTSEVTVLREDDSSLSPTPSQAAQISLTDCLACSGCITSSEAVLIQLQSHTEVLSALKRWGPGTSNPRKFYAILSPQTRAALAAVWGISTAKVGEIVERMLRSEEVGFDAVVKEEVMRDVERHFAVQEVVEALKGREMRKPVLSSSCPGFICYLESTHPSLIPHLSHLKSPMSMAGMLLKSLYPRESVYIVGIMPCFDKKLEASRKELTDSSWRKLSPTTEPERDIDCVITTRELLLLAAARRINPLSLSAIPLEPPSITPHPALNAFLTRRTFPPAPDSGTSGGLTSSLLSYLQTLNPGSSIIRQPGRLADTISYTLLSSTSTPIVTFSRVYGFRNISNLVRRLKPKPVRQLPGVAARRTIGKRKGEEEPVFIEVMACPGGCTNGEGQVKFDDEEVGWNEKRGTNKELLKAVDEAYFSGGEEEWEMKREGEREVDVDVEAVVKTWEEFTGGEREKLVNTTFRVVENDVGERLSGEKALEVASRDSAW